jgi:hypothetical protein
MGSPVETPDIYLYSDPKKNKVKGAGTSKKVGRKKSRSKSKYKATPADKERIMGASKYA